MFQPFSNRVAKLFQQLIVSADLISGEDGTVLSHVKSLRIKKAPFQGDVAGGRKYFENTVAQIAAKQIVKSFGSVLGK